MSAGTRSEGMVRTTWRKLRRDPLGLAGFLIVVGLVLITLLAPWLATHPPNEVDVHARLLPPSTDHWLGTDQLGRDVFSRVLYGGRVALKVALLAIGIAMVIGIALGMLAGYGPRWLDRILLVAFDTVRSFPTIMFALAVVALVGPSLNTVIAIIIVASVPIYARVVRTQTLALRERDFILASMDVPVVVGMEAGLSFLGLGVSPPTASWGSILNDGYAYIRNSPWPIIAGGLPLILVTLGFTFFGEALRDILDPKLRRKS